MFTRESLMPGMCRGRVDITNTVAVHAPLVVSIIIQFVIHYTMSSVSCFDNTIYNPILVGVLGCHYSPL